MNRPKKAAEMYEMDQGYDRALSRQSSRKTKRVSRKYVERYRAGARGEHRHTLAGSLFGRLGGW